ncbi:NAD(P)-dependent oxidoreductase [Roseiconus lacunae]|uniref:NAD-dependent epimerase/dehydratase family protein n=1 Tax=Roseiconus lacunae TaxID=2605694 RepID=UPI00308763C8|nr:NAD(P)-dependent oxidoreductase [Stieleria sp. HD01]
MLPQTFSDEADLERWLCEPSDALIEFCRSLRGRLLILGAGGKMGPTLAVRAQRAIHLANSEAAVTAVSRFTNSAARTWLENHGVETYAADLLDRSHVDSLPEADHVIYLVGSKFGTRQNPSRTWAVNTIAPTYCLQRYQTQPIVALSTGNVYPLVSIDSSGSAESDSVGPIGEYANAALARERLFEYFSIENKTPVVLIRLNYAVEARYGVLVDLAIKVHSKQPIDLTQGYFNCIWQGDANDAIIRALPMATSPANVLNLTGDSVLSVRSVADRFGEYFGRDVTFIGQEATTALLNDSSLLHRHFGKPSVDLERMIGWIADWVQRDQPLLGKPTHFEVRDGGF